MRGVITLLVVFTLGVTTSLAQETFPRNDVADQRQKAFAITNATIVATPTNTISNGTLLIRSGKIEQVGANVAIPAGYTIIDAEGKYVYPSFVDIHTSYGMPKVERRRSGGFGGAEQVEPSTEGAYNANDAIKSHYNAAEEFSVNAKEAKALRRQGFGAVMTFRADGIARGSAAFVTLGEDGENNVMISERSAAEYSFNKGSSRQLYPSSAMGFIALLRQTYLDASWYDRQNPRPFKDQSLESWLALQTLPQVFEATNWLTVLRADKVGDEFGKQYIIKGGGDAYKRIDLIKATNAQMIVPVNFPDAYDVEDPFDAERVSLADMKHWEMAPANLSFLEKNQISFAITTAGLNSKKEFLSNVRRAIDHGLSEQAALAGLTTQPAAMVNMSEFVGTLEAGKLANFFIASENIFGKKAVIHENWVQGTRNVIKDMDLADRSGTYDLQVGEDSYELSITGMPGSHKAEIRDDTVKISVEMKITGNLITVGFSKGKGEGRVRLSGWSEGQHFLGEGQLPSGDWVKWSATYESSNSTSERTSTPSVSSPEIGEVIYPFVAYGSTSVPQQEKILVRNATVWTNEADGILEGTDVLLENGKIARIGTNLSESGARVIDGTNKHLTPGIIDEHSHLGASSINDRATNSSMVRIGDVIDPDRIGLYRALAGGVVAAQILHGSANPIGGQSALIKMRWGAGPEGMKIQGADGFIKFALGENVKRSTNPSSIRYPQTRMGVEQVFVDAFTNAREYKQSWDSFNRLSSRMKMNATPPRRDLVHETMLEILEGRRFISCHSYVQSEINMLMKVAERFDFRINTFTHILEGYKVADKMAAHGVGASTFSDWWNYKWEVRYAIPYNATIMHNEGVVTAVNSDSRELIRRLNQEAAKSIKYGGMSEEDALKLVTLNPAKLLHLDDQMGSIKVGKSADVVLWTDHPLSIYAKADKTIIEGTVYFDLERDAQLREEIKTERARLIQKMKDAKKSGARSSRRSSRIHMDLECESVEGEAFDLEFH